MASFTNAGRQGQVHNTRGLRDRFGDAFDNDHPTPPKLSPLVERSPVEQSSPLLSDYSQSVSGNASYAAAGAAAAAATATQSDGQGNQTSTGSSLRKTPAKLGRNGVSAAPRQREKEPVDDDLQASASVARATPPTQGPPATSTPTNTAIDPLSQHILMRTLTEHSISRQTRIRASASIQPDSPAAAGDGLPRQSSDISKLGSSAGDATRDKRKGVSFLSRLSMRTSKKHKDDDTADSDSEFNGELRTDGSNARVFSSIVGAGGFIPLHKEPPRYIRIRAQHKREREFNRMFLAQELVGTHPRQTPNGEEKGPVVTVSMAGAGGRRREKTGGAIWATEFSKDGKYFAAAGKDAVVRVWAVISTHEDRRAHEEEEATSGAVGERLSAPVFIDRPVCEFQGHTGEILDLSWSKNNFLLSTGMDKTVRLWHVSRKECLCTFKHKDLVTKVVFHPMDDRFFLAGSLDSMLRLWSIPDKTIAYSVQLPDLITAVAFSPDGKVAIAGLLNGLCMLYETEGLKHLSQIHAKSSRGKNSKGSKITGIQTMVLPQPNKDSPPREAPEVKLLISTNDSRIRIYGLKTCMLDVKLKGHENAATQISASFSDDGRYIISGSEDRRTFIWNSSAVEAETKDKHPSESFDAHGDIVTTALFAPTKTRQLLSGSGDPIYDLCNPPPVTLLPTDEAAATASQSALSDHSQGLEPLPAAVSSVRKIEESPAYVERSKHHDGNIIVTSDYQGIIKVFRQDCAFQKRRHESWETGSNFSRRLAGGPIAIGRSGSILTRTSMSSTGHSRRGSLSGALPPGVTLGQPSVASMPQLNSDRILSWRQGIEGGRPSSIVGGMKTPTRSERSERSVSPNKNTRTPASGSRANLAADARKQQYAAASPNHARVPASIGNDSLPASPMTSSVKGQAKPTTPVEKAEGEQREELRVPKTRTSKEEPKRSDEVPTSPPVPSFSFRPVEEDDGLRLDPAGASYSFWNISRWKGIAGLRSSISGPPNGSASHGRPSVEEERYKDKAARRKTMGAPLHHSPLSSFVTATNTSEASPVDASHPDGQADQADRRRSLPAGSMLAHASVLRSGASTPPSDHGHLSPARTGESYLRPNSEVSKLSSELTSDDEEDGDEEVMHCAKCGGADFKAKKAGGRQRLVCGRCGSVVEEVN